MLGCEALGQLNGLILAGKANELIQMSENMFNDRIFEVANDIRSRGRVKFIFISGPSSSGKTTFSLKLALQLKCFGYRPVKISCFGYRPVKISLDNYYFTRELVPVDSDGNKDYETLEALDLEFFRQNLDDLLRKGRTTLPHFSFRENRRHMDDEETVMGDDTVFIVEGIHGLNPALAPDIDQAITYRIYISALTSMIIDDHNRISTTDYRMIRRAVVDRARREEPHLPVPEQCGRHDKQRLALRDVGIDTAGVEPAQVGQVRDGTGIRDGAKASEVPGLLLHDTIQQHTCGFHHEGVHRRFGVRSDLERISHSSTISDSNFSSALLR